MKRLVRLAGASAVTVTLVVATGTAHAATWKLETVKLQLGATQTGLEGVSCVSASYCPAVGHAYTLSEIWNATAFSWKGIEWHTFPPEEPGEKNGDLHGVSCWAEEGCASAGAYGLEGLGWSLVEEYKPGSESKFKQVTTPNPSNGKNAEYFGISCPEKETCVAVGQFLNTTGGGEKGAVFASEGEKGTWSALSPVENPGGQKNGQMHDVSCIAKGECIAAGGWGKEEGGKGVSQAGSESWNKSKNEWKATSAPEPFGAKFGMFYGISCKSATFCIAVGKWSENASSAPYQTFADTWNGTEWKNILYKGGSEDATEGALYAVSCTAIEDCEMVGSDKSSKGAAEALAYRWNKGTWTFQKTEFPTGSTSGELEGISCTATEECAAVGTYVKGGVLLPFSELL